jgi:hypothetical protein
LSAQGYFQKGALAQLWERKSRIRTSVPLSSGVVPTIKT